MDIRNMGLPGDVLTMLAPAVQLVQAEAREGTVIVERSRAIRTGKTFVRANGGTFRSGAEVILDTVYPGATLSDATVPVAPVQDDDEDDDDEDDTCDDNNCCGYCGCCSECGETHDIETQGVIENARGSARYCTIGCEHWCTD